MKGFNEFIGESGRDWLQHIAAQNILSDEQCQYIEDILGTEIDFINNQEDPEEYRMFDQLIEKTLLVSRALGEGSIINRYEVIPGLDILYMRPNNPMDLDRWVIIKESVRIALNKSDGNLDDWKIDNLFRDF
jgi:hypothetical protein